MQKQPQLRLKVRMNESVIVVGGLATILNLVEIILICKTRKNSKSYQQLLLSLSVSDVVSGLAFVCSGILLTNLKEKLSWDHFNM